MAALISGISMTCFAGSYFVAWLLEIARFFYRSGIRRVFVLVFVLAGLLAHTLYLGYRGLEVTRAPLSSSFDWYLVVAWLLMVAYLYLSYSYPRAALGLYVMPLELILLAAAAWFADDRPIAPEPASRVWGAVHGVFLLCGSVAVMIGFVAGAMYLIQANRLKRKLPTPSGLRFPSLEWLEKINGRMLLLSTFMVGIGFIAGIVLNLLGRRSGGELPWTDPVVWSSGLLFGWLVAATLFNAAYRPARQGRKVAYLTVASFFFLVLSFGALLVVDTEHGGRKRPEGRPTSGAPRVPGWMPAKLAEGAVR